jgi:P-type conjugative transfer protein TrbG
VPELVQVPAPEPPTPAPVVDKPTPAEQVYDYLPGTTFQVTVPVDVPLDVVLQRGEQVRNIVGGDRAPASEGQTARWEVKEGADGNGETLRHHVFLTAVVPHMTMGMIITTTHRTYLLTCKSVKSSPVRVVRWRYPPESEVSKPQGQEPPLLPDPATPRQYHIGYELVGSKPPPVWQPRQVVDDGKKTYILYPEVSLFDVVPMLRLVGPNGPQLVNSRQFFNVVIVDQLVGRAEVRVGLGEHAEVVTITRGQLKTIRCPGDARCPVWPNAAQMRAQRPPSTPSASAGTGTVSSASSLRHPATDEGRPPPGAPATPLPDAGGPGGNPRTHVPAEGTP